MIYAVDHLGREGDDVGLAQLGDGLDHGGRGIGREVRGWIGHRLTEENPRGELEVLAWCWRRSQGWTWRAASTGSGRGVLVETS